MLLINGDDLGIEEVIQVARHHQLVGLKPTQLAKVNKARHLVEELLHSEQVVYGITTGFGHLANTRISLPKVEQLQQNLIFSHSCGVGEPLSQEIVRGMMLLRANALIKGYSGVRPQVIELLIDMLNKGVTPKVYSQGSVGASGDLVQLAHLVLVMTGYGEADYQDNLLPGLTALEQAGLKPLKLQAKEGLALINGTQCMTAMGALGAFDGRNLTKVADITAALTMEVLRALPDAFDHKIHQLRPHPGQIQSATNIRLLLKNSELIASSRQKVQDAYTLRCTPQVHGASRDALSFVWQVLTTEINSATDNPLIFPEENQVLSAGNFHGQPVALALDFLGIALAELANISERRVERLVNPQLNGELPPFLTKDSGLNSGCMIAQYTAASLVSENKVLAHPASVDSITTSANQEDHVSMGTTAARKMLQILQNVEHVLSIELLSAAQAGEFVDQDKMSIGTRKAYEVIREYVPPLLQDRVLAPDIAAIRRLVHNGKIVERVEQAIGPIA